MPEQQSEVCPFGNAIADDLEGRVTARPLEERLIDQVDCVAGSGETPAATVISNPTLTLPGATVDAAGITPARLEETLHEADAIEPDFATGHHAIGVLPRDRT